MFKFIYTQDEHGKMRNPRSRCDNYYQSWIQKIEEVCQVYKKENCDYWLSGGDLLDRPLVSYGLIDDFIDLIEKYEIKLKLLFGNHTMIGANVENSKHTSLAHIIRRSQNIQLLSSFKTKDIVIDGYDYYFGIEDDINEKGLICKTEEKVKIAIVHALITDKPFFKGVKHNVIGTFKTNYDYILIAHNHYAWGNKKIGNTHYINIGAFGRTEITETAWVPSYIIYDGQMNIKPLLSAKPGSEIFDLESYKADKKNKQNINDFIKMINNVKFQEISIVDIIKNIAKENQIEKNVVNCIMDKIGEVQDV